MSSSRHKQRPPFRAEHIGSLLRPAALRDAVLGRAAAAAGGDDDDDDDDDDDELSRLADAAVASVAARQVALGFCAPTDGEYRRVLFLGGFHLSLEGFEDAPAGEPVPLRALRTYLPDVADFLRRGEPVPYRTRCTGRIRHVGRRAFHAREFLSLRPFASGDGAGAPRVVPKITLVSPLWYYTLYREGHAYPKEVYANDEEYLADLSRAYRREIDLLYDIGCRNIQIDDPYLTGFCDERVTSGFVADGVDPDQQLLKYMRFYNDCLAGKPDDLHIGMHMCRGNYINSRYFTVGGYDKIARTLFGELEVVDTFYLEYDDSRSGGFEPLRFLPRDKNLILGLVSTKTPRLEDLGELKARVWEVAGHVAEGSGQTPQEALERLGVSPQCGFASHVLGNAIAMDDMFAKLKLVRQLADEIWPEHPPSWEAGGGLAVGHGMVSAPGGSRITVGSMNC